jgi:N-acetylglucosamine malate deacetylase 1
VNVLVIAPHPDDEAIGCGGAVCKHAKAGDRVAVVFLTSGELGLKHLEKSLAWKTREAEAAVAAQILGVSHYDFLRQPDWMLGEAVKGAAAALMPVLEREQPRIIYVPHPDEWHPDHKAAVGILTAALGATKAVDGEVRGYEVWTPLASYEITVDITTVMAQKLEAIKAHQSQLADLDYAQAVQGLNAYRGAIATRTRYAEVFRRLELISARGCS